MSASSSGDRDGPRRGDARSWTVVAVVIFGGLLMVVVPVMAGMIVPALMRARGDASRIQCGNNLVLLYVTLHSDASRLSGSVSSDDSSSIGLFNAVLSGPERARLEPASFICAASHDVPALRASKSAVFRLEAENCSYDVAASVLTSDDAGEPRPILWDKAACHDGRRMVLFSDHSVRALDEAEFREALASVPTGS